MRCCSSKWTCVAACPYDIRALVVAVDGGDVVGGPKGGQGAVCLLHVEEVRVPARLPVHAEELSAAVGEDHTGLSTLLPRDARDWSSSSAEVLEPGESLHVETLHAAGVVQVGEVDLLDVHRVVLLQHLLHVLHQP